MKQLDRKWTPEEQSQLAVVIGQMFDMQKQFGKEAAQLENIVKGFCWLMEPYPVDVVVLGFRKYMQSHADFPTPADIINIIDPKPPAWKPDKAYYISLKQIYKDYGPYGLSLDEIEYIARYEEHMRLEMKQSS